MSYKVTNIHEVIQIDDTSAVVIDKKATIDKNDWVFNANHIPLANRLFKVRQDNFQYVDTFKVIATIGFRKLRIPSIILSDDDLLNKLSTIIAGDWAKHEDDYPYIHQTAEECYNAIQAKGQYTEDDMINFACNVFNKYEGDGTEPARKKSINFYNLSKEMITSLQAKQFPIAVELEYERWKGGTDFGGANPEEMWYEDLIITNIETNTIIPINIIYQKINHES